MYDIDAEGGRGKISRRENEGGRVLIKWEVEKEAVREEERWKKFLLREIGSERGKLGGGGGKGGV